MWPSPVSPLARSPTRPFTEGSVSGDFECLRGAVAHNAGYLVVVRMEAAVLLAAPLQVDDGAEEEGVDQVEAADHVEHVVVWLPHVVYGTWNKPGNTQMRKREVTECCFFFNFEGPGSFIVGPLNAPVLDFYNDDNFLVSKPEWVLPYSHLSTWNG